MKNKQIIKVSKPFFSYQFFKNPTNFDFQVQDVNDNAPMFETPTFSFDILENAERGAIVGRVEATDLDRGSAASRISYTFISDWGMDTFSLDPTSGVITLSGNSLDHEVGT